MPFLTLKGLAELQKFKTIVNTIAENKYEDKHASSPYSKQMAKNALEIIGLLEKNNDKSILSISDLSNLVKTIQPLVSYIDNKTFTAVPAIFNAESLLLAIAFKDFLKKIKKDFNENVESGIKVALKLKSAISGGEPEALLDQHIREIEANIIIYSELALAKEKSGQGSKMEEKIADDVFGDPKKPKPETFFAKLKNAEYKEEEFQQEYKKEIEHWLSEMLAVPYTTICYISNYVNCEAPYHMDPNDLKSSGTKTPGKNILYTLQYLEDKMNNELSKKEWKSVSLVSDFKTQFFSKEKVEAHKSEILQLYKQIEDKIRYSLTGRKIAGMFSYKVDPKKQELLNAVLNEIKKSKESKEVDRNGQILESKRLDGMSRSLIFVYVQMLDAGSQNRGLTSSGKKLNPGETGRILQTYAPQVLALINRGWGNDEEFCLEAQKEQALKEAKPQDKAPEEAKPQDKAPEEAKPQDTAPDKSEPESEAPSLSKRVR
jgi:hypothetical protein